MKKVSGIIFAIVILVLARFNLLDRIVNPIVDIFVWLFTLSLTQSSVSIAGEIFVKITTFAVSYAVVGAIFNTIGWFNSGAMKIAYFVISTILSFALCYVVMLFETHILQIAIATLIIAIGALVVYIIYRCFFKEVNSKI